MVDRLEFDEIVRIQNLMSSRIAQENEVDLKLKILDIISQLLGKTKKFIQIEEIIIEGNAEGLEEGTVLSVLDQLEKDHMILVVDSRVKFSY